MNKKGLFCGRFQPIHLGHQRIIDKMLSECEEGIVLIGDCELSRTMDNPFNVLERIQFIQTVYKGRSDLIIGFFPRLSGPIESENDYSDWGEWILGFYRFFAKTGCLPIVYGGDDAQLQLLYTDKNIKTVIVQRDHISASLLRNLLLSADYAKWRELIDPALHQYFPSLVRVLTEWTH